MKKELNRNDLVYPELSYEIIGCAYEVCNKLGGGLHEKYYQKGMAVEFELKGWKFKEQAYFPLEYKGKIIGKSFLDFLVDDKIIVEIKKDTRFSKEHIDQVNNYLKVTGLKLALLINFSGKEVFHTRILNINSN